jgi:hypothetical protein|tara:strand:- start:12 stop:977 length:966 start_codon:yes stop_codon:yes gene_type:complete
MENDMLTTDEEILSSIGEGDESTSDEGLTEQNSGTPENITEEASTASDQQSASSSADEEQQPKANGPQDLVDASGNLIAAGGKERRFYETAQREKQRADQITRENDTLKSQLEAISKAGSVGQQYNLSPDEVTTGAQIVSSWKDNPVETLQYMLTQAQSEGYNVDAIVNGGADMGAMKQMLDNALSPIIGDRQQEIETREANERATEIYTTFSAQHPDAAVHEDSLSRLLQEDSNLSVDAAYFKLQNYYLQRGLDWTKSLSQLQTEHETASPVAANINMQPQPPEGGSVSQAYVTDTQQVADVRTSTDDIIRQAMADAGIQ